MRPQQRVLREIEDELRTIRIQYTQLDIQRARLEGKEVALLKLRDSVLEQKKKVKHGS